jgi:hypothetical protein
MDDSFKKELDTIKAETPVSVRADPASLLYGIIFIVLGVLLLSFGGSALGLLMIVIGAVGVAAGAATFVSKSPKVKIVQAIDSFLMAILLLVLAMQGGGGFLGNPLIGIALAGFMVWTGYADMKEYRQLRRAEMDRAGLKSE